MKRKRIKKKQFKNNAAVRQVGNKRRNLNRFIREEKRTEHNISQKPNGKASVMCDMQWYDIVVEGTNSALRRTNRGKRIMPQQL
jgi:hypothetical protein